MLLSGTVIATENVSVAFWIRSLMVASTPVISTLPADVRTTMQALGANSLVLELFFTVPFTVSVVVLRLAVMALIVTSCADVVPTLNVLSKAMRARPVLMPDAALVLTAEKKSALVVLHGAQAARDGLRLDDVVAAIQEGDDEVVLQDVDARRVVELAGERLVRAVGRYERDPR